MEKVDSIDTNLQGQRLGRKGRITRERIMSAARELIEDPESEGFSFSAVARRTGLRLSSIYNYFADPTELFLSVLEPVADASEEAYIAYIDEYWPDEELEECASRFVEAFHAYWQKYSRILHMRNQMADNHDTRVLRQRINMSRRMVSLLGMQMGGQSPKATGPIYDLASVLYMGLERVVTVATNEELKAQYPPDVQPRFEGATLNQQAILLALAIAHKRSSDNK